jgi:hypothetical protein
MGTGWSTEFPAIATRRDHAAVRGGEQCRRSVTSAWTEDVTSGTLSTMTVASTHTGTLAGKGAHR